MKKLLTLLLCIVTAGLHAHSLDLSNENQGAPTGWHSGQLHTSVLDGLNTTKTWNNIDLLPGTYRWTVETRRRGGKTGKVNFDVTVKYASGPNSQPVNERLSSGTTHSGTFVLPDYMSRSNGGAGYARVKIHIGRAGINTNVNYKIILTRIGVDPQHGNNTCTYTRLGGKNGNIISNTRSTYSTTKRSCKNTVEVRVTKTSGRARTTVTVYSMNTPNGSRTFVGRMEFPKGNDRGSDKVTLNNMANKYFFIELKNHSATNTFKFESTVTQSD
jgi:hypothetical protein